MDGIQKNNLTILLNKIMGQEGRLTNENEITYICKFHTAHNNVDRRKFGISLITGCYNCFACGESGKSFKTLFKKLKASPASYKELYSIIGEQFKPNYGKSKEKTTDLKLPDEFLSMAIPNNSLEYRHALNYLKKRNVTRDDILRYNIGYCESGLYRNRIVIPSYDKDANLNFFSARDFLNVSYLKYLLPPWSKDIIGNELYINWNEPITLVEGSWDALSIRNNAIPLFGKYLPNALKEAILEYDVKHINICLDSDAHKDSIRMIDYLNQFEIDVRFIQMYDKDPSKIGFDEMIKIINSTKTLEFSDLFLMKINL
jgi:hypothetical protein